MPPTILYYTTAYQTQPAVDYYTTSYLQLQVSYIRHNHTINVKHRSTHRCIMGPTNSSASQRSLQKYDLSSDGPYTRARQRNNDGRRRFLAVFTLMSSTSTLSADRDECPPSTISSTTSPSSAELFISALRFLNMQKYLNRIQFMTAVMVHKDLNLSELLFCSAHYPTMKIFYASCFW